MNNFVLTMVVFLIIVIGYAIIDRICKCIEHCADANGLAKLLGKNNETTDK